MKLVIGSLGWEKADDIVRVDIVPEWGDIACDIRKGIPLIQKFEKINCKHILEHIQLTEDFVFVMWELYRLLEPGGELYIEIPHKDSDMAYECIGHTRYFVNNSFKDFYDNPYAKEMDYPQFKFVELHNRMVHSDKVICLTLSK